MNKQELLNDLKSKDFVEQLIDVPKLQPGDFGLGINWYTQEIFESVGNVGTTRTIHFFVLNEGKPNEKAVYKDRFPMAQSRDFVTVSEYVDDGGKILLKQYLLKYEKGILVKTEITKENITAI